MGCKIIPNSANVECKKFKSNKSQYLFKDGMCYQDGQLIGDIVEIGDNEIVVRQNNGSFADGTMRTFYGNFSNQKEEWIRKQAREFADEWFGKLEWEKHCDVCKEINCKSNRNCIRCGCQL